MTFNRVCSIPLPPSPSPSPSLVWPFDREESISQERHVSKVRESDPPSSPLLSPERCESPQDGVDRAREGDRQAVIGLGALEGRGEGGGPYLMNDELISAQQGWD